MKKVAIIFGSNTDNTKNAAEIIAANLTEFSPQLKDVSSCSEEDFMAYDHLFLGTSTWGLGELQDDWCDALSKLSSLNLSGKTISLFGLGDSDSYADTFVNAMGELYDFFSQKGCEIIGSVPAGNYSFGDSTAVHNNEFVGLALDADNEDNLSEGRIKNWLEKIKPILS